jgi:DNA (cytosine-5)-methyltransferase 1
VTRPRLLDLFCGAGGCSVGYHRAGFDVVGVDIAPQPRYPYEFVQADALEMLSEPAILGNAGGNFAVIHASPPCQRWSVATVMHDRSKYPDLIGPTRDRLATSGLPCIIENVPGAPLRPDYKLCGCMFDLPGLRRERWFETSWQGFQFRHPCHHVGTTITVSGHGSQGREYAAGTAATQAQRQAAMGIDWMTRDELSQAIPPAYTEYIGAQLLAHLEAAA